MLQGGHILGEFDATDEQIVTWLRRVSDPDYWREEQARARAMLEAVRGNDLTPADQIIADLLDRIFYGAAPPARTALVEEIFASGYLDEQPDLAGAT